MVSADDRRAFERQQRALTRAESDDEGDTAFRDEVAAEADRRRTAEGRPPLEPWWATKTEPEFHARARALGLLDRDR